MKFREHREFLADSIETVVELADIFALKSHIQKLLEPSGVKVYSFDVKPYAKDERIGWDTYIVTVPGYGVVGFVDGPAE